MTLFGIVLAAHFGNYVLLVLGAITVLTTMFFWWRDVMREGVQPAPIARSCSLACATA